MTGISENFYTIYRITNKINYKTYIDKHITEDLFDCSDSLSKTYYLIRQ